MDQTVLREILGRPGYKMVDTCAAEFPARTPYFYSTADPETEVIQSGRRKVLILGSGPIRIGQGIEFDYCTVHAVTALREEGIEVHIVNNNPETVSTDFDTSDRLFFEPMQLEDVMNVLAADDYTGVMVQFGGQNAVNLAVPLQQEIEKHGLSVRILGTSPDAMDVAEDRDRFSLLLDELGIPSPPNSSAYSEEDALRMANEIGYPVLVRPSLRPRRARDGDRPRRRGTQDLHEGGDPRLEEAPGADRLVPAGRDRDRRGCGLGRHGRADRRDHGAHRGGRRPLGRLGLRDPDPVPLGLGDRPRPRLHAEDRTRPRRGRADEPPARGQGRHGLRPRGEPAGLADRAVRLEGDRDPAREGRGEGDDRPPARGARVRGAALRPRCSQGGAPSVQQAPGRRHRARARDEVDRRGDGDRLRLRPGILQGPDRGR